MRMPFSVFAVARWSLVLAVVAGSVALISAPKPTFTVHDKAYYADQNTVNFVRPGLVVKLQSAAIAADGTITATVSVTDPKGLPLDREGITTPGTISMSFIAATIPKGQKQYTAYTFRTQTSPITHNSATQASADSGGTFTKVSDGVYTYTFRTKAPSGFDASATHSIGVYGSRSLAEFDLGTQYADNVLTFVPNGGTVSTVRDVVRTPACNACHDQLAFHGGSRRSMELCILCHTPQTSDPDTGNTVDMPVMTHRIHAGATLPSVQAGGKYQIIGNNQSVSDWSSVVFPADVRRCEVCHVPGASTQADNYLKPSRAACGACHDNVNFATGENHVNLPQVSDNECANCHIPQGELEFDASIKGAHTIPEHSTARPGINVDIVKVDNGTAGNKPTVTFTVRDDSGAGIPLSDLTVSPSRMALVMAGPTKDYGYTSFGSDVTTTGYVSEDPTRSSSCSSDGTCTYTFTHAIPADAKGTFAIGIEARRGLTLLPGTKQEMDTEYGAINKVAYFSVDGSTVQARRAVVDIKKCNQCHAFLSLHGENRNQIEMCVLCHNSSETDKARRVTTTNAEQKALPPQSVDFSYMIHRIHTGEQMQEGGGTYTVIGFGGSVNDFSEVRYPAFDLGGHPGDRRNCEMCHIAGTEQLPLQAGLNQVNNPQGLLNPSGPATTACLGCHVRVEAASHALAQTTTQLGESCSVCHGSTADASVDRVHAR